MARKMWYKKVSFSEAEESEREYYLSLSPEERLNILQELREMNEKFGHEGRKGLRRVLRVVKRS